MDITQDTNITESLVTGRNGHHKLKAIRIWSGAGKVYIDGIGKTGTTLNAGFIIDQVSYAKLLEGLNKPELEDNQRDCECKCPKCGAMGDDIDWDCTDTEFGDPSYSQQTATCRKCKTDFCEVYQHVYQYTELTGDFANETVNSN